MNPITRAQQLDEKIKNLLQKNSIRWTFIPSEETSFIKYFPTKLDENFENTNIGNYVSSKQDISNIDIIICTCHGSDVSKFLFKIKQNSPNAIIALWLFDNHIGEINNLKCAMYADILMPSHRFAANYLPNPISLLFSILPACCCQWTEAEASDYFSQYNQSIRNDKLLLNYVDYTFSSRTEILKALMNFPAMIDSKIMPENDRDRYFKKTPEEKFSEWAKYKCTVILPVKNDVSTRIFDALIAGLVPIIPKTVQDLDGIISPSQQETLGIIRINDTSVDSILDAIPLAIRIFDSQETEGILKRHKYVLENHLITSRINSFFKSLLAIQLNQTSVKYIYGENQISGLYLTR